MAAKHIPPSTNLVSFNCPNCGAMAHQTWYQAHADSLGKDNTPSFWTDEEVDEAIKDHDQKAKESAEEILRPLASGVPFLHSEEEGTFCNSLIGNTQISACYSCGKIAIWLYGKLVYPADQSGPEPNVDIPDDILKDYQEASTILDLSPRGAAALLRLCIQKICIHLGEDGKDLNTDIGSLVEKGLDQRVQKSLDTVRVVGNESVHPG